MGGVLFWTYLALGVTLQLLSLLSLAGWLKRTVKEEGRQAQEEEGKEEEEEEDGGQGEGGRGEMCEDKGMRKGGG